MSREENRALNTNRRPSWSAHSSSTVAAALNSDIPQGCFTNLEIFQWRESSNTTHTVFASWLSWPLLLLLLAAETNLVQDRKTDKYQSPEWLMMNLFMRKK